MTRAAVLGTNPGASPARKLSPAQQPIWYSEVLSPNTTRWTLVTGVFLDGAIDTDRLATAAGMADAHFPALRTRLALHGRVPMQAFPTEAGAPVRVDDLSGLAAASRQQRLDAILEAERLHSFALYDTPLHYFRLVRLGPREHVLLLCEHHTAIDAAGVASALRAVARFYQGAELPGAPDTMFESWLDRRAGPAAMPQFEPALAHFSQALQGAAFVQDAIYDLADDPRREAAYVPPNVLDVTRVLGAGPIRAVRALGERCRCSLFVAFLAAYRAVLASLLDTVDLTIGVVVSGRAGEPDDFVGMCVNTGLGRLRATPRDQGAEAAVREVAELWRASRQFQNVPLHWLSQAAPTGGIPNRAQFVINMLDMRHSPLPLPGVSQRVRYVTNAYPTGDLVFSPTSFEDGTLGMRMIVGSPRISRERVEAVFSGIEALLSSWSGG